MGANKIGRAICIHEGLDPASVSVMVRAPLQRASAADAISLQL
jgi:hypothetical protein